MPDQSGTNGFSNFYGTFIGYQQQRVRASRKDGGKGDSNGFLPGGSKPAASSQSSN
jgi:hypothetical protein